MLVHLLHKLNYFMYSGHTEHIYLPDYKMTMHVEYPCPFSFQFQEIQNMLYCVGNYEAITLFFKRSISKIIVLCLGQYYNNNIIIFIILCTEVRCWLK